MDKNIALKQIILITDGRSNIGGDPVVAAKHAYNKNIIVNTIGIINKDEGYDKAYDEIASIAKAGGGSYEYTHIDYLYQTMKSLTLKTVNQTIQEAVNKQLKEIMGKGLDNIEPSSRGKLLNYIEEFSSEIELSCCIVMDCSGSMNKKIDEARYSILDLMESFKNRKGKVNLAVIAFPGSNGESNDIIHSFTDDERHLKERLYNTKPGGSTPTALALERAIALIDDYYTNSIGYDEEHGELEKFYA